MIEAFLLGFIAATSLMAGLFFLKFWRETHDILFLAFAASFTIEGLNRIAVVLFVPRPNEGSPVIYIVRMFAFVLILAAIIRKNYGKED